MRIVPLFYETHVTTFIELFTSTDPGYLLYERVQSLLQVVEIVWALGVDGRVGNP